MARLAAAIVGLAFAVAGTTGPAAAQQRELGAHEHGRGTLNIAIEGTRLTMELEAPGVDIVGFEHKAKSAKDKAAVEPTPRSSWRSRWRSSSCRRRPGACVKQAAAKLEGEDDHGHAHGHSHGKAKDAKQPAGKAEKDDHGHSQFHAEYALDCKSPGGITAIEFDYFGAFAGAQKLDGQRHHAEGAEQVRGDPRQAAARSRRHDVELAMDCRALPQRADRAPARRISSASSNVRFAWPGRGAFSLAVDELRPAGAPAPAADRPVGQRQVDVPEPALRHRRAAGGRDRGARHRPRAGCRRRRATGFRAEHFGIIFQMFNLLPYGSVIDNVLLPLSFAPGRRQRATREACSAEDGGARACSARLGLEPRSVRGRSAANLSVGQQQRVAAARALIGAPELDRRRRADLGARPRPPAGVPRPAVRGGRRGGRDADHGQPRREPGAALRPRAARSTRSPGRARGRRA